MTPFWLIEKMMKHKAREADAVTCGSFSKRLRQVEYLPVSLRPALMNNALIKFNMRG